MFPQTYIHGGRISAPEAVVYLKGTNAYVSIDGAEITTGKYLIHTIVDDDPMQQVLPDALCCKTYGMKAALKNMTLTGDIVHEEVRRDLAVTLEQVHLTGRIQNAYLSMTDSHWFSPGDSKVAFVGPIHADWLDAPEHVVIEATAGPGCVLSGSYPLKSGGHLIVRTNA